MSVLISANLSEDVNYNLQNKETLAKFKRHSDIFTKYANTHAAGSQSTYCSRNAGLQ